VVAGGKRGGAGFPASPRLAEQCGPWFGEYLGRYPRAGYVANPKACAKPERRLAAGFGRPLASWAGFLIYSLIN